MPSSFRRVAAAALLLCLVTLGQAPAAAGADAAPSGRFATIDAYVRERMKATRTPGLAYAVVGPDGPVHSRAWGTDGHGERVTTATPFLWGSVAKPIAASAVMTLVQDGRVGLDDRVVDHLPAFRFGGTDHAPQVTVRHLLTQTAGLPESATFEVADCVDTDCPGAAERIAALDDVTPLGRPGSTYAYTSANYLVLAAVVESATGLSFADHLQEAVLGPAGMDGAIADRAAARRRDLPPGHQLLWGVPSAIVDGVDDAGAAYGYTGGDLDDLAAFASLQLRSGKAGNGATVLTPESVRLMREPGRLHPSGAGTGYGLGWRVGGLKPPLDTAIWHTGATPGYSAMLFLLPEQNIALVLQQNLHGLLHDEAVMEVGFGAARILAGSDTPTDAPSAAAYSITIWGLTALTLGLLLETFHSIRLLRRPTAFRILPTVLWCLAGTLPAIALTTALTLIGPRALWIWTPDVFATLCGATVAGVSLTALRLARLYTRRWNAPVRHGRDEPLPVGR
ncbi:serine hydrolase [Streptomyces sp. NBC_00572]|uniref:serine hydrolase domain-containing protein n=1 Tax=Streptomyces sp. NBC_00572 TaxID=2903664 RepID=UPI00224DC542|nr:serine hydrolase domain-containing protein [Streptomyces sp. NBC_00572]MCX4986578.1 beta-lactamase family protein [Streptomyces sp. NBC_00572]